MTSLHAATLVSTQFANRRVSPLAGSLRSSRNLAVTLPPRRCRLAVTARQAEVGVGMFGTKAGMTQIFTAEGLALPATVIAFEEGNIVAQVKTSATDGYDAVQVGYRVKKMKEQNGTGKKQKQPVKKAEIGHLVKHGAPPMRHLREFKLLNGIGDFKPGQQLKVDEMFKEGDIIDVAGTSIGKGFQGSIKRWGMARGNMTHGSKSKRQHGSIGNSASPSRVFPGLHMAGHMGAKRVKARKLKVITVDPQLNAIIVHGSVPGKPGNVLELTPAKIVGVNYQYKRNLNPSSRNVKAEVEEQLPA